MTFAMQDPGVWRCGRCGSTEEGRFCERCGWNSPSPPARWLLIAVADRGYFEFVREVGEPSAARLRFPAQRPERAFPLTGGKMIVGRHRVGLGQPPRIDLSGPGEDPAIGRSHAMLTLGADGSWSIRDLQSVNGTYLNDFRTQRLGAGVEMPLAHGDRVFIGAWTRLTVHRAA